MFKRGGVAVLLALALAACDPEAPIQGSDVDDKIDAKIEAHAADSNTHDNLLVAAANITGEIDGADIEAGSITLLQMAPDSVSSDEIADQSITNADMGADSVNTPQLVNGAVTGAKIAVATITTANIGDDQITSAKIANNTIATGDILNGTITGADIAADTIASGNIAADTIDDSDVVNDGLDSTSIAADAITASELANNAVDTNAIADANVTEAKLAANAVTAFGGKLSIPDVLGAGTMGAAFNDVFTMKVPTSGTVVRMVAGCESDQAASQIRLSDNNQDITVTCPDTNLNGPMSLFVLEVTTNMANEDVIFRYKSMANGDTTRWRIFGITAQ